jgi:hypothetical protein
MKFFLFIILISTLSCKTKTSSSSPKNSTSNNTENTNTQQQLTPQALISTANNLLSKVNNLSKNGAPQNIITGFVKTIELIISTLNSLTSSDQDTLSQINQSLNDISNALNNPNIFKTPSTPVNSPNTNNSSSSSSSSSPSSSPGSSGSPSSSATSNSLINSNQINTLAGNNISLCTDIDGPGEYALFCSPIDITGGVAGNVYISGKYGVRKMSTNTPYEFKNYSVSSLTSNYYTYTPIGITISSYNNLIFCHQNPATLIPGEMPGGLFKVKDLLSKNPSPSTNTSLLLKNSAHPSFSYITTAYSPYLQSPTFYVVSGYQILSLTQNLDSTQSVTEPIYVAGDINQATASSNYIDGSTTTMATFGNPKNIIYTKDSGGTQPLLYICDGSVIRKLDILNKTVTTIAGYSKKLKASNGAAPPSVETNEQQKGNQDGPALTALFSSLSGISIDTSGNLWVSDSGNLSIRKVNLKSNTVSTVVTGLINPGAMYFDIFNNLYFIDGNAIKMISGQIISTVP